jgi:hypothetical protein
VRVLAATARQLLRLSAPLAILGAVGVAVQHAEASTTPAAPCAESSLRVVVPRTEGTATQIVAFLSVANRGGRCQLVTSTSLIVIRNGARVASIRGNPVSYRINQTIGHGTTVLFDAWWGNWCADRSGSFRVRGVLGAMSATAPYLILPLCIGASEPSRLRGVRAPPASGAAAHDAGVSHRRARRASRQAARLGERKRRWPPEADAGRQHLLARRGAARADDQVAVGR